MNLLIKLFRRWRNVFVSELIEQIVCHRIYI